MLSEYEISNLKKEIENIKEYIESDLCKTCEQLRAKLEHCEELLQQFLSQNNECD